MQDSIFAKIIRGEIPCHKIYEDEHSLAFLDVHPKHEGHTLVIPKNGAEFVWDLSEKDYVNLMKTARKVALHLQQSLPYPYIHLGIVGVDVPYAHVHLIPFSNHQDLAVLQPTDEPDHTALATLAQKLALS
jgi:histidine triad (HIT) family protein